MDGALGGQREEAAAGSAQLFHLLGDVSEAHVDLVHPRVQRPCALEITRFFRKSGETIQDLAPALVVLRHPLEGLLILVGGQVSESLALEAFCEQEAGTLLYVPCIVPPYCLGVALEPVALMGVSKPSAAEGTRMMVAVNIWRNDAWEKFPSQVHLL